ncbi:hypothetical protein B0H11DRAFT_2251434 [Mycena galericulata]|nr:hypothetical protein B0H11DRAFT_2251434 [Mycena galericulata]
MITADINNHATSTRSLSSPTTELHPDKSTRYERPFRVLFVSPYRCLWLDALRSHDTDSVDPSAPFVISPLSKQRSADWRISRTVSKATRVLVLKPSRASVSSTCAGFQRMLRRPCFRFAKLPYLKIEGLRISGTLASIYALLPLVSSRDLLSVPLIVKDFQSQHIEPALFALGIISFITYEPNIAVFAIISSSYLSPLLEQAHKFGATHPENVRYRLLSSRRASRPDE